MNNDISQEKHRLRTVSQRQYALYPRVPEEVYTDRQEFLDYFYDLALKARTARSWSTVLLGQRRMGKTEIFLRVVSRLFWEQDHRDPQAVIPVYYSFRDEPPQDRWEFALSYVDNFLRWYVAFRLREPQLLDADVVSRDELMTLAESQLPMSSGLQGTVNLFRFFQEHSVSLPEEVALQHPVRVSDRDGIPIAVFLDEFQNTRIPDQFSVVGYMQKAVESWSCPHFVTGSAMSILTQEIIGRGALFGRFTGERIEPLTQYWGAELAHRAARYYQVSLTEEMAPVIADRCGGNPFYITAIVRQAGKQRQLLHSEDAINDILAVDLSSGFIWGELDDQVSKWMKRINAYGITKWVLYLSALDDSEFLDIARIRQELHDRDGQDVPIETIRETLIKLSRGDLLEASPDGNWFRKIDDPILVEFLKVWGRIVVEGQDNERVQRTLQTHYQKLARRFHEYKGYLGEIFMAQILYNAQDKTLPGRLFHTDEDVHIPWHFNFIRHRMRLRSGKGQEIDLIAAALGGELWVCQSTWRADPVGIDALQALEAQGKATDKDMEAHPLRLWLFTYSGLRPNAEAYAKEHGIFWSGKAEFDELLEITGLRPCLILASNKKFLMTLPPKQ